MSISTTTKRVRFKSIKPVLSKKVTDTNLREYYKKQSSQLDKFVEFENLDLDNAINTLQRMKELCLK